MPSRIARGTCSVIHGCSSARPGSSRSSEAKPSLSPGGRLTASWASEATTCTTPVRSIVAVRRRTVEPKPPVIEPAVICTSTPASTSRCEPLRVALEGRAALRVGEQHAVAARRAGRAPAARRRRSRARTGSRRAGRARRRAPACAAPRRRGRPAARSRSPRPGSTSSGISAAASAGRSASQPGRDARRVDAAVVVDVRRREDRPRARRDRGAGELERPLERRRARRRRPGGCGSAGRSRGVHL